jgi:hypothetical protein
MSDPLVRCALALILAASLAACQKKHDDDPPVANPALPTESFFVFVDGTNGTPAGTGTRADPLDTVPAGITLAKTEGKAVCVAEGTYAVDSSATAPSIASGAVSLYGGYRNTAGAWSRDTSTYVTTLGDAATAGSGLCAVACDYGAGAGMPSLDGFALAGATAGTSGTCLRVTNDSSVTLSGCAFVIGATATGNAVLSGGFVVRATGTVALADCTVTGGGGSTVEAINVYRYNLTLRRVTISGLTGTGRVWAVDTGYGAFTVDACDIDAGTPTALNESGSLYINECFPYTVTNSTLRAGRGTNYCKALDIMDTELVGGPCLIQGNLIDGGSGATSIGIELGWAEIFPSIIGNTFEGAGTTARYGIYENDNVSEPVAVVDNVFDAGLADPGNNRYLYRDYSSGAQHLIGDAATLNVIDEAPLNYNPAGSVHGNTVGP